MATPTPSTILDELRHQHEALRGIMDRCEQLADELDRGRVQPAELTREVAKLRIAFDAHNRFEEQILRPVLHEIDAFGTVRLDQMVADHVDEHRAIHRRLDGPTGELRSALYGLRAHLAAEERYFLSARVLRDDLVTVEGGG